MVIAYSCFGSKRKVSLKLCSNLLLLGVDLGDLSLEGGDLGFQDGLVRW